MSSLLDCLCVSAVCARRGITDSETATQPSSTNSGPTRADELTLTRGTCFAASRLEFAAVVGLQKFWWLQLLLCVWGAARFCLVFFSSNAQGL